jgi:hypothetical protein
MSPIQRCRMNHAPRQATSFNASGLPGHTYREPTRSGYAPLALIIADQPIAARNNKSKQEKKQEWNYVARMI